MGLKFTKFECYRPPLETPIIIRNLIGASIVCSTHLGMVGAPGYVPPRFNDLSTMLLERWSLIISNDKFKQFRCDKCNTYDFKIYKDNLCEGLILFHHKNKSSIWIISGTQKDPEYMIQNKEIFIDLIWANAS